MILVSPSNVELENWKNELRCARISIEELLGKLDLPLARLSDICLDATEFNLKVTKSFLNKITLGNPNDPLLRQILPDIRETKKDPAFKTDPVGDNKFCVASKLIKKYQNRALMLVTQTCPVHCRYCFRKHFPYHKHKDLTPALQVLADDDSVNEIILSGGDPLSLDNKKLFALINKLESISHIKILRIHSRYPVALPARFDSGLLDVLKSSRFNIILVSHINHPQEIDLIVYKALKPFRPYIQVLNQSVLLKGINDNADTLAALSYKLLQTGILPYYLHMLDRVQGASHFAVSDKYSRTIIKKMRATLPGYLVPRLVREVDGLPNKELICA